MAAHKERWPRIACELSPAWVVVARAAEGGEIEVSAVRPLKAGSLTPNLAAVNMEARDNVKASLAEAMLALGHHTRDVITILPDAACRVALLDFDTLPDNREDAGAVVRFRLKKSLPFDVDKARLSWQKQRSRDKLTVLAAVVLNSVLEEYESVVREAGFNPGVVIPSILASLGQVDAGVPTLVVKVDPLTTSIAIVADNAVALVRTLDHAPGQAPEGALLAEDLYPSLMFFQDTYGTPVKKILVSGVAALDELNSALGGADVMHAEELVGSTRLGVASVKQRALLGAVAGALS